MEPLISVIIPVYKVEKYLDRCVESLVGQSYRHLEILLVDDGSPDGCPALCDAWAAKDARIRVIHKTNGGLSSARNAGLDQARGDYIYFADSDDYIAPDTLESLCSLALSEGCDMTFGKYRCFSGERAEENNESNHPYTLFSPDSFWTTFYALGQGRVEEATNRIVSWDKLIKRSVFETLRFDLGKIHEDEYIIHKIIGQCERIGYIDRAFYYYFQNPGGIISQRKTETYRFTLEALADRCAYFAARGKAYTPDAFRAFFSFYAAYAPSLKQSHGEELKTCYRTARSSAAPYRSSFTKTERALYRAYDLGELPFRIVNKVATLLGKSTV